MKAPLKAILKNFLDHVNDLEARKEHCDDQYEFEFQELKKLTDKLKEDPAYPSSIGLKDVNRPKNRYKDIVPYDFSRVILPKHEGIPGSDYINASYVKGASGALAYIAAQGPLPNTVIDFWRMIWVCDVQVIVMACNEKEAGKFKCEAYWPGPGEIKQYGNISIELVNSSQVCLDFLVRTFLVKCGSEMRDVFQFHYTSWPDHGVPDTVQPILDLVRLMRDCQASETVPIVVHCSAGCGRTGTICAVDYVWACLRHGKLDEDFSLYQIALELRRQRIAMIQTKEQYILAHKAVAAMFEQQLKVIDCHIYENLDEDGEPLIWKEVGKGNEFEVPDFMKKCDSKERPEVKSALINKSPIESKNNSKFFMNSEKIEVSKASSNSSMSHNSSMDYNLNMKTNALECVNSSGKNSESSFSRNSILSQQSNEDSIPFIDDDDVCVRPNCGRAYLDIPDCDSITKLVNCFDPFVDKVSVVSDDSSPDGDPISITNKIKDFELLTSSKTLGKNAKISTFNDSKCETPQEIKQVDSRSNALDLAKKSLFLNNRESYPPSTNNENFQKSLTVVEDEVHENSEDAKNAKKVGKATVVRRPSISKLKALFEKSGISSQKGSNEGSKRLLFRNNSHCVSRAGSAPPSLDCMDKNSAVEKESILRLVTRKFRSSSVRTEKEMQSQQHGKTLSRRSATDAVKDGINALTRTMSFTLNKTFKSYSPAKTKPESNKCSLSDTSESIVGIYKQKSIDQPKGNSMWYDRSSLPRAVAVVKPTGKFEAENVTNTALESPDKTKSSQDMHFNYTSKPTKLKEFFIGLNKKDSSKDSSTLWYNESNTDISVQSENNAPDSAYKLDNTNSSTKSTSKVLPFLPMVPWKKVGQKSPLSSPDSPKCFNEATIPRSSSTFYDVLEVDSAVDLSTEKHCNTDIPKCPVPEEIIPLDTAENKFWPSNSLPSTLQSTNSEKSDSFIFLVNKDSMLQHVDDEQVKSSISEVPPAIPKKMVIGKNKNLQNTPLDMVESQLTPQQQTVDSADKGDTEIKSSRDDNMKPNIVEKNDLYINVNIKAMKNIEQIENSLRKNPRGAIIDLTSRESYSMEEELVNAVNQLSESSENKTTEHPEKNKALGAKSNSKFPGYEVIWPEQPYISLQKSKSSSKVPLTNKSNLTEKHSENLSSNQAKTGICYSPPLRRSANANLKLAKSQSCGNLDWLEPDDPITGFKEQTNTPTKRLVNEAVVELNTLLNQLTTRTLSEDIDLESKSKENSVISQETQKKIEKHVGNETQETCKMGEKPIVREETHKNDKKCTVNEEVHKIDKRHKESNIEPNDTVVHSVTLVTKSYNSGSSPKEEEIVFHFPPPPRVPPPKDESPIESFNIVCTGRSLLLKDPDNKYTPIKKKGDSGVVSLENSSNSSNSCLEEIPPQKFPQPAPRKSKQTTDGLRRSSSYSNIGPPQSKNICFENIFLEKYQTLSRLEIKPENKDLTILDKVVPFQKPPILNKTKYSAISPNYVNVADKHFNTDLIGSQDTIPVTFMKSLEPVKREEDLNHSVNVSNNQVSGDKSMVIVNDKDSHSVYGRIYKVSEKSQIADNLGDIKNINSIQDADVKKKPIHSKKTERAPLPPNIKQIEIINNEMSANKSPNSSLIPKKLPSRKLEKAPLPPHLLQKNSSTINAPKKNLIGPQPYVNFPPVHQSQEKPKLSAVRENVPNVTENTQKLHTNVTTSVSSDKFVNRGLSHSQSDVSVFLALKERRIQAANHERKLLNMKSLLLNKGTKNETVSMSSSDSDSSYERIFLTNNEPQKTFSKTVSKEQTEQLSTNSYRKEVPVAPPRSKRRSTMEVQYSRVKSKDASHASSTSQLLGDTEIKNSKRVSSASEDIPPAIPMKTRDAFEIPEV